LGGVYKLRRECAAVSHGGSRAARPLPSVPGDPHGRPGRDHVRALARDAIDRGDPSGWFETLYREGETEGVPIPWADRAPNPHLVAFFAGHPLPSPAPRTLVVACGLGDDAAWLASRGAPTTGFDISPTAVRTARARFPLPRLTFLRRDLLHPPEAWRGRFDLVLEAYTLQALPASVRPKAIDRIAGFIAPGGHLLVVCRARRPDEPEGEIPWPLTRAELERFHLRGLRTASWEEIDDPGGGARRFRIWFERPPAASGSGRAPRRPRSRSPRSRAGPRSATRGRRGRRPPRRRSRRRRSPSGS
jgi:hypothetical protein